jgi:hypothetical protein
MSPFEMLGDADALACDGDSCLLPSVVTTVAAVSPGTPGADRTSGGTAADAPAATLSR